LQAKDPGSVAQQNPRSLVVVDDTVQSIDITERTRCWIDDHPATTVQQLLALSSSGSAVFKNTQQRDILRIHDKALWLRFEVHSLAPQARWLLEIGNPLTDDVQLHWRDAKGVWHVQKAGDAVARSQWPVRTRMPTFYLDQSAGQPVEYFLRMVHQRAPVSLQLKLHQDVAYIASQQTTMLTLGLFFGLLLLVLSGCLIMAAIMRDGAFLAYSGYVAVLGGFMLTNVGLSAQYLWPDSPMAADRMVFVLASLSAAIAPVFVRVILKPVMGRSGIDAAIKAMVVVMLTICLIELLAPTMASYVLINAATVLSLVLVYVMVFAAWQRGDAATRWIAIGFVPVVMGVVPILARNLGLINSGFMTQYGMLVGVSLEIPLLLHALTSRSMRRRDNLMRSAGLPMEDALTRLPNLRSFINHLHGVITRAARYRQNYGLLIIDLANEAWFAKEHTREVADQALILLASRLQRISRDVDLVSRIGPIQFAMVIEGPCDARRMANWAARIAAYGQKPNEVLPVGASLKLKITCALMPSAAHSLVADEANEQLAWVIAQADALPIDPRNTVHTLGF
jgi:two-component system, sensor histidine kinase LadS